jgi:uncharacterized membrane protein
MCERVHRTRPSKSAEGSPRYLAIDTLRGLAMVWMTVFHFCFDLQQFGYLRANFYADPLWTWQRVAIVSLFVFCAGFSQAVAVQQAQPWARFWKRWRQIAFCALLVSAGSYAMYPQSFIYFGILHGVALMLILVRFSAHWGRWLWLAGAVTLAMPLIAIHAHSTVSGAEFLNEKWFNWLGLISRKPVTEDYAPLFPWLGVMWWGMAAGQWCLKLRPKWLNTTETGLFAAASRPLALLGRWNLSYYMLHQPVMIGALMLLAWLR